MKFRHLFAAFLFILPFNLINGQEGDSTQNNTYSFTPSVAGGQIELCVFYAIEMGALVDIDLITKRAKSSSSFGARLSHEAYAEIDLGGGSSKIKDYCFYLRHSLRSKKVHFNYLGGVAYHEGGHKAARVLFRVGFEVRYNLLDKLIGLVLKGATSFEDETSYLGIGVAMGFYK